MSNEELDTVAKVQEAEYWESRLVLLNALDEAYRKTKENARGLDSLLDTIEEFIMQIAEEKWR